MNKFSQKLSIDSGIWLNPEYLKTGNERQKLCYEVICRTRLFEQLREFHPIAVGTIPIGIDIPGSDLDVVCSASSPDHIRAIVRRCYSHYDSFSDRTNGMVYCAGFNCLTLPVEIYAEPDESHLQNGYRHMVIEERILRIAGEVFRQRVIGLKKDGLKTEPAFGKLLGLKNPYTELLKLENLTDKSLKDFIKERERV